jgi:hypothetical protein
MSCYVDSTTPFSILLQYCPAEFLTANANHGSNCITVFHVTVYSVFFFSVFLYTAAGTDSPTEAGFLCHEAVVLGDTIKERPWITS